ncbi:protein NUCLEAR FUSION DEFECTIVE 2 [Salvia miltiorrhiza]|uniref:protein NUCLEAR FUSION DEFECTIVE 2 n=1 Tax=Salvia miltiorrhiza TaxID=226208 RepID=UPI0025AD79DD|nr:protein NUCLEAR FUSION DEFECTIVE 2 [Salvia miltiorrhiza]
MGFRVSIVLLSLLVALLSPSAQAFSDEESSLPELSLRVSTPFSNALANLQNQINYTFKRVGLLRRAMTHSSYSEENNKALSVLGESVIETSVALQSLRKDVDISAKDLNLAITEASKVEGSCNADGIRLGLQNVVRVASKTNATAPAVVCGAFRALFGAIAIDAGSSDEAGDVYGKTRSGVRSAVTM